MKRLQDGQQFYDKYRSQERQINSSSVTIDDDGEKTVKQWLKPLMACCNDLMKHLHSIHSHHTLY